MKLASSTLRIATSVFLALTVSLPALSQAAPPKWKQGDLFLGVGGGKWKVLRPSTGGVIDSVTDGLSGNTNASGVDNTWHLIGTDSGNGATSKIVRFSISPHDPNNQTSVNDVLSVTNGSVGINSSVNAAAIAIDGGGNMFLANSQPATILKFSPSGSFVRAFSLVGNVDGTLAGADVSPDGNTLYYTSSGGAIRALPLNGGATPTITTFASLNVTTGPNKVTYQLYGLRVVPAGGFPANCTAVSATPIACPNGGFLVAAKITRSGSVSYGVLLLNGAGAIVRQYMTNQSNLRSVALNPLVVESSVKVAPDSFWTASPNSGNAFRVRFDSTLPPGPFDTFSSGASTILSLGTYGGFGANQPAPTEFTSTLTGAPSTNSAQFLFETDQLTLTGYNFPANFSTNVTAFATAVPPAAAVSDTGLPCTPTIGSPSPNLCAIWEVDIDPPLPPPPPAPALPAIVSMKFFATAAPQSALNVSQVLRNMRNDVTDGVANLDPMAHSIFSVYALVTQPTESDKACAYLPPVANGAVNKPGNITFRFQCAGLPGTQLSTLFPRISIVQLASGSAPSLFFPGASQLTGGTCCTIADYRYDSAANMWVINVSFKSVTVPSTFIATTFDDNHIAGAFFVQFTVSP